MKFSDAAAVQLDGATRRPSVPDVRTIFRCLRQGRIKVRSMKSKRALFDTLYSTYRMLFVKLELHGNQSRKFVMVVSSASSS